MTTSRKTSRIAALLGIASGDVRLRCLAEAAYFFQRIDRVTNAAKVYSALEILAPNDPLGPLGLAECGLSQRDYAQAAAAVHRALRAWRIDRKTMALAYKRLAEALYGLSRSDEALQAFWTAAQLDPEGIGAALQCGVGAQTRSE